MRILLIAICASGLVACAAPGTVVTTPTTTRPQSMAQMQVNQGAIFQSVSTRPLFEEPVARRVGDLVVITIEENLSAVNKANTNSSRTGALSYNTSGNIPFLPTSIEKFISRDTAVAMNSSNSHTGKGETNSTNTFTGTIAATVIEVMSNGNLMLGGEKKVAVNGQINTLRFSGVVSPSDIKAGNTVSSNRIADARIEQVGQGVIADANTAGWMQRVFYSIWPF